MLRLTILDEACIHCEAAHSSCNVTNYREGRVVCSSTGIVVSNLIIDQSLEGALRKSSDRVGSQYGRTGGALGYVEEEFGISSSIECGVRFSATAISNLHDRAVVNRLQVRTEEGFAQIKNYGAMMSLSPSVIQRAQEIYKETIKLTEFKSRDQNSIVSATLLLTCALTGVDRSLKEIVTLTGSDERTVRKLISKIKNEPSIKILLKRSWKFEKGSIKPSKFIYRFCSSLKLDAAFASYAYEIARVMEDQSFLEGSKSSTRAAACIVIAINVKSCNDLEYYRSYKDIASVSGIAESTIKQAFKKLHPHLDVLIGNH
jgi:transcription initiation factor TFIIB